MWLDLLCCFSRGWWRCRCGGGGAARRERVHAERGADTCVGGVIRRPLQVGGVLDGLQMFVEQVGVVVADAGGIEAASLTAFLGGVGAAQRGDGGLQRRGIGINPASGFQGGEIGGVLDAAENDVGAGQDAAEIEMVGNADLKLFAQFHALTFEGEDGSLFGATDAFVQDDELFFLLLREFADAAFFIFHVVHVGRHGANEGARGGDVTGGQARGDGRVALGRGGNEVALAQQGGDGEVELEVFSHVIEVLCCCV